MQLNSSDPSGEVTPEKSIFPQLQNVQTVRGGKKNGNGLLIVNSLVFERGARPLGYCLAKRLLPNDNSLFSLLTVFFSLLAFTTLFRTGQ